ncbi:MAG: hypothetical protein LC804_24070 [Acidobacteria bacterium]|nr:hypothetical protein [Acidobacteriota bacterium]
MQRLIRVFNVAAVDDAVVRPALALDWPDFEDAVCAAAAEASGCDALVTRDPDGYPDAPLAVMQALVPHTWTPCRRSSRQRPTPDTASSSRA